MVRAALGDAMSLSVLMRVLGKALHSSGLFGEVPRDLWRQLAKDAEKCNLGTSGGRVMPDEHLEIDGGIMRSAAGRSCLRADMFGCPELVWPFAAVCRGLMPLWELSFIHICIHQHAYNLYV